MVVSLFVLISDKVDEIGVLVAEWVSQGVGLLWCEVGGFTASGARDVVVWLGRWRIGSWVVRPRMEWRNGVERRRYLLRALN